MMLWRIKKAISTDGAVPRLVRPFICLGLLTFLLLMAVCGHQARAQCIDCGCPAVEHAATQAYIAQQHAYTQKFFGMANPIPMPPPWGPGKFFGSGELGADEHWWNEQFLIGIPDPNTGLKGGVIPALQLMTEQLVGLMMNQALTLGAVLDAKQQLEAELLFQQLTVQAHKDYQPSLGMCTFGTGIRSLAAANRDSLLTMSVLNEHSLKRQEGNGEVSGAQALEGERSDRCDRLGVFANNFCDFEDNDALDGVMGTGLGAVCSTNTANTAFCASTTGGAASNPRTDLSNLNRDVDFTRTIIDPDTIRVDMADTTGNHSKPLDIFTMQDYLYSHDIMSRIQSRLLKQDASSDEVVDYRTVEAKRSVAENSFAAIVGMKTMGTGGGTGAGTLSSVDTLGYMSVIMTDLGVPAAEIPALLAQQLPTGATDPQRPSYYAQLRFLAKRLYQRPDFYSDLYDTPVNVERKKVAMQAVNSILDREIYNSYMRQEAILSQILELHVQTRQNQVEDDMKNMKLERR